jgi:AAA+ superfamily predicted ATPase
MIERLQPAPAYAEYLSDVEYFKNKLCRALGVPMFADENGDVAVLEPEVEAKEPEPGPGPAVASEEEDDKKAPEGAACWPAFIAEIDNVYRSNRSHVFVLHGNVNDYPDNTGVRGDLGMKLFMRYDKSWLTAQLLEEKNNTGNPVAVKPPKGNNIACRFSVPDGLVFATTESFDVFVRVLKQDPRYADVKPEELQPKDLPSALVLLNDYFKLSATLFAKNQPLRAKLSGKLSNPERTKITAQLSSSPEANLTVIWYDAKMCFPNGQVSQLTMDRTPIAFMENWALNGAIAPRNKIIMVVPRLQDLQESLRSGDSRVAAVRISRPNLEERKEWLAGFNSYVKVRPALINGQARTEVVLAEDINWDIFANGAAGMSRVQMEAIFMEHWLSGEAVSLQMVAKHKKKALEAEYGDILDIRQPDPTILCPETKGKSDEVKRAAVWSLLGGHDLLKQFAEQWVVEPMILGDRRRCTRGFILAGPPGTGKTWYGELLAAVAGVNFVYVDFSKLYGGIVGDSEKNTERLFEAIEAMAPCIVFADELDMAFPAGRASGGDSGVSSRMMGRTMKWLSDDARWGKVVVLAATNRPDGLDAAFMRAGRFDDILPALPPHKKDVKGRKSLLGALCKKANVRMHKSLAATLNTPGAGLGRLLFDDRIWTGAEMERLVKLAFGNAAQRVSADARAKAAEMKLNRRDALEFLRTETKNPLIELGDWEPAMKAYRPKTREVDEQIDLALGFCNNAEYCPADWQQRYEEMQDPSRLAKAVESIKGYSAAAATYERE